MIFGKKEKNAQMLTDITRGIHHAVNSTGCMLAQQYVMLIQQFFDTQDDGTLAAKMVRVQVDDQHDMLVPLISLVQPQGIALDEMHFDFSIQISESELKKATHEVDNYKAARSAFKVELSPKTDEGLRRRSDVVDVGMKFKHVEAPEGIMRIIEQYTNLIKPFKCEHGHDDEVGPLMASGESVSPRKANIVKMNTKATGDLDPDKGTS